MSAGPIQNSWHEHFPIRPGAHPRRVEPVQPQCPPTTCQRDRFEPLPFDKFLERQNQEFRAAAERHHAGRRSCTAPELPVRSSDKPEPPPDTRSRGPRIGDVAPTLPQPGTARLRTVQQFLPPIRPGRIIDLLL